MHALFIFSYIREINTYFNEEVELLTIIKMEDRIMIRIIICVAVYLIVGCACEYMYTHFAMNYLMKMCFKLHEREVLEQVFKARVSLENRVVKGVIVIIWPFVLICMTVGCIMMKILVKVCSK